MTKILKAVDYDINTDINFVQLKNSDSFTPQLLPLYSAPKYLFFGLSPKNIGLQLDWATYKVYYFRNAQFLLAHALHDIAAKPELKSKLWQAMQLFFRNEQAEI